MEENASVTHTNQHRPTIVTYSNYLYPINASKKLAFIGSLKYRSGLAYLV